MEGGMEGGRGGGRELYNSLIYIVYFTLIIYNEIIVSRVIYYIYHLIILN